MKTHTYFSEVPVIGEILIAATMVCVCTATTVCQLCENGDKVEYDDNAVESIGEFYVGETDDNWIMKRCDKI